MTEQQLNPYGEPYIVPTTPDRDPLVEPWASWWLRVLATLMDFGLQLPFTIVAIMFSTGATDPGRAPASALALAVLSLVASLAGIVFSFWNTIVRQGRKGASLGKQACGLLVLSLHDARPIGAGMTFVRSLAHTLDVLSLGLGYLWPLWDQRRQTFADKVVQTGVLRLPDVRF